MTHELRWIIPNWPAHLRVKARSTTRIGGQSTPPFDALNLALHVNDNVTNVEKNRKILSEYLPAKPLWLNQIHSTQLVENNAAASQNQEADASWSNSPNQVCVVMTADCLPVLLTDEGGQVVAAVHAGWRGLADGIVEKTIQEILPNSQGKLMAWMGPAISQRAFQVGAEVKAAFAHVEDFAHAFMPDEQETDKFYCDLYALCRKILNAHEVEDVYGGEYCTYTQSELFFSYRRVHQTGRMATMIWIDPAQT